ncbi:nitronate monooxygenase family protein [Pelagibius sp. Alg239-R121]|uniref:NAD(P)H-dependent flavin oxidoreductase n=1 Tax=Pelagibius sp. Alg239-R121 TaxID=2993448 RepID=UPI0024A75950|nr:nitronate monooxygenase [Pelagibius sp. Alg239-R121]
MIRTKLTTKFGIDHPILLAPMDKVSGGTLAAAVTAAGGLGLIGGGYGDAEWLEEQFSAANNQPVGVGFITWALAEKPHLMDLCLERKPRAMIFAFGDATEFVMKCRDAGVPSIWQVHRVEQARQALSAGTDVIVVQGQEAGGHGMDRGLATLLPAVRDAAGPDQIIVAAGGIGDGRGLAGSLMLGADGIMMGTRFWAATEANGLNSAKARLVEAKGDDTLRTKVFDVARGLDWPWHFSGRVLQNDYSRRWHGDIDALKANESERTRYNEAEAEDYATRVVIGGEVVDLIHAIKPAGEIISDTVAQAEELLSNAQNYLT